MTEQKPDKEWTALSHDEQEQAFHEAVNGASYWARKRLLKKMDKRRTKSTIILRPFNEAQGDKPKVRRYYNREMQMYLTETTRPEQFVSAKTEQRPAADLELWVSNFCLVHRVKGQKKLGEKNVGKQES